MVIKRLIWKERTFAQSLFSYFLRQHFALAIIIPRHKPTVWCCMMNKTWRFGAERNIRFVNKKSERLHNSRPLIYISLATRMIREKGLWRPLNYANFTFDALYWRNRTRRAGDWRTQSSREREDQSWRFSWKDFARDQSQDWESFIFAEPRSQDHSLCNSVKMVPGGQSEFNLLLGTPGSESPGSGWGIIVSPSLIIMRPAPGPIELMVIGEMLNQFSVGVSSSVPEAWLLQNLKVQINLALWVGIKGYCHCKVVSACSDWSIHSNPVSSETQSWCRI